MRSPKILKILCITAACVIVLACVTVLGINAHVKHAVSSNILQPSQAANLSDVDCILVLGCGVRDDGTPSDMLRDRLDRGIELYQLGASDRLLMSGDHGQVEYDEVNVMKQYAMDDGIASSDIFMDHAGFSTYESMYRAKEIFGADKILIVTQEYHLYRALYIAKQLGIDAYGVSSDYHVYAGQFLRDGREILARNKDFLMTITKPEPTYLGEAIPISGNGDLTND